MSPHSPQPSLANRVRDLRASRGWPQAELARRAGISRAAVSGIEIGRLVPSVAAALALARALGCRVEDLFGLGPRAAADSPWAWSPPSSPWRFWHAEVAGRLWAYPVESVGRSGQAAHDAVAAADTAPEVSAGNSSLARQTLVVACCDPAAGLLASAYRQETGFRMIVVPRGTQQALDLLGRGLVHMAGLHLSTSDDADRNAKTVQAKLGGGYKLLHMAAWEDGLAVAGGRVGRSVRSVVSSRVRWVAREPGSASRQCLEQLLPGQVRTRRVAYDHWTVAEAVRCGWADAGVCLRLPCEEAGLRFLPVRNEFYELCYAAADEDEPRIQALLRMVRASRCRERIGDLPGYDASESGSIQMVTER